MILDFDQNSVSWLSLTNRPMQAVGAGLRQGMSRMWFYKYIIFITLSKAILGVKS